MIHELFAIVATALIMASVPAYVVSIRRHRTIPSRATYAMKALVNVILLGSYLGAGARISALTLADFVVSSFLLFGLSLSYGYGGTQRLDVICGIGATVGLVLWAFTGQPIAALVILMLVKWASLIPTLVKLRRLPDSESRLSWWLAAAGDLVNLGACSARATIWIPAVNEALMSASVLIVAALSWPSARSVAELPPEVEHQRALAR